MPNINFDAARACVADSSSALTAERILTDKDYLRLEVLLHSEQLDCVPTRRLLERLLAEAEVVSEKKIASDFVTIGSLIHYRLGILPAESRRIVLPGGHLHRGAFIPLDTILGISLIGRKVPDSFDFNGEASMTCRVIRLEFQPVPVREARNYQG